MRRTIVLLLLTAVSLVFGSSPSQYLRLYNAPVNVLDKGLLALPTESGIDILSLSSLSLVDHIDAVWPDRPMMTMNNGKIAYIEKEGEGETLKVYDLKTKESKTIKTAEKSFWGKVVLSDDFVGYRKGEDAWDSKLYISSVDGSKTFEVGIKGGYVDFKGARENLFVIKNGSYISVYDPVKQKTVASTQAHKGNVYCAPIYGEWVVYIEASWDDEESRDVWLWNYQTGEERLISKGIDGRTDVDRQDYCVIYGDIVVWHKLNNASGERDPAICMYSIGKNETKIVKKGQFSPIDLEGDTLLLWDYENKTYLLHDLSTGKERKIGR